MTYRLRGYWRHAVNLLNEKTCVKVCLGRRLRLLQTLDAIPFGKARVSTNNSIARIRKKSMEKWPQSEGDFAGAGDWKRNGKASVDRREDQVLGHRENGASGKRLH